MPSLTNARDLGLRTERTFQNIFFSKLIFLRFLIMVKGKYPFKAIRKTESEKSI